ncbi:MAG: LysR family transcriptional regulator [Bacteroidales bacterium]|nr:LysR family transcriptional regulator [Bacteroidales bacterium]
MEIRQLKYFLRAAETLNFSVAAKELFVTQSTLSQQILNLEQELNQPLLERNPHNVMLTEGGRMLLPLAKRIVSDAEICKQQLLDLKDLKSGELNIGVTFSFSSIAGETMLQFLNRYPNVKINVQYAPMSELMEKLVKHDLDFVLAFRPSARYSNINSEVLFKNRLSAIVNEFHPLAKQQTVTFKELECYDFALPSRGLQARHAFEKIVDGKKYSFRVKVEINYIHLLFRLIRNTQYVTVLSETTVLNENGLRAVPLDEPGNDMDGCIHTLKNTYLKNSAKEFIKMLRQAAELL